MNKTLVQINSVVNYGSTGKIAEEIGQTTIENGWISYIAYGRYTSSSKSELIKIGNNWDKIIDGLQTRMFDMHGKATVRSTKKLVQQLLKIKPDIIHLHNIHGYFLNYEVLFEYLQMIDIPIVWTLHDCWPITGHCAHFDLVECEKWKTTCYECPQLSKYPSSLFIDRSRLNYKHKKNVFTSVNNLTLVPVSNWLSEVYKNSFLNNYPIEVINNGIDLNYFNPSINNEKVREKYNIGNRFMILGVATTWSNEKGLSDFVELSKFEDWEVVLVGIPNNIKEKLPKNIRTISRTNNQRELADLYSAADVFVNPTYQDSFPTVNIESLACGTPIVTYNTGGSPEAVDVKTGIIVKKGDIKELINAIYKIKNNHKKFYLDACLERARKLYDKNYTYSKYLDLYNRLLKNNITLKK